MEIKVWYCNSLVVWCRPLALFIVLIWRGSIWELGLSRWIYKSMFQKYSSCHSIGATVFFLFFSVRLLSVLCGHSGFSSPPQWPMTSDFEGYLYQILSITLFSYLNSWERASISPFHCWVLYKGTTGTIFITYFVWRGPWLGIEPGTSRTRSQHSTTRLSRRRSQSFILKENNNRLL